MTGDASTSAPPDPLARCEWPRATARLVLRRATAEDVPAIWSYRRLPEVNRWLTAAPDDLVGFASYFGRGDRTAVSVVVSLLAAPQTVVGDLMVRVGSAWSQTEVHRQAQGTQAELGWAFTPAVGGLGYATEAVAELLRLCFADLGLRRVEAGCFAANEPSWRLMERLGMRREAHSRADGLHRTEGWLDGYAYALLADEWRARG